MLTYRNSTAQPLTTSNFSFVSIGTSVWTTSLSCLLMSSETCRIWKNCEDDMFFCFFFLLLFHYFPHTLFSTTTTTSMMIWNNPLLSLHSWVWPYFVIFCLYWDIASIKSLLVSVSACWIMWAPLSFFFFLGSHHKVCSTLMHQLLLLYYIASDQQLSLKMCGFQTLWCCSHC